MYKVLNQSILVMLAASVFFCFWPFNPIDPRSVMRKLDAAAPSATTRSLTGPGQFPGTEDQMRDNYGRSLASSLSNLLKGPALMTNTF